MTDEGPPSSHCPSFAPLQQSEHAWSSLAGVHARMPAPAKTFELEAEGQLRGCAT